MLTASPGGVGWGGVWVLQEEGVGERNGEDPNDQHRYTTSVSSILFLSGVYMCLCVRVTCYKRARVCVCVAMATYVCIIE